MSMTKSELLRALDETHDRTLEILRDADPLQVVYEESGWRVKDVVAHIVTWETESLRSFHAFRRGGAYSIRNFIDEDDFNGFAAASRMEEPMPQIMEDWSATRSWLKMILNAMSEDELSTEMTHPSGSIGTARALAQDVAEHEAEHAGHLRAAIGV
jgi:hypothetical protein